ncbi:MAG: hypothetical protein A4S08_01495 [Proteobacteria bacterium SG_bin4]|nr:MAG: hypothetical protein A4S08_01495 [Proteobacteria bacterium SG_bin4]
MRKTLLIAAKNPELRFSLLTHKLCWLVRHTGWIIAAGNKIRLIYYDNFSKLTALFKKLTS